MKIKHIGVFMKTQALQPHTLADTDLVIDGLNFFYNAYRDSKLPFAFGAECDEFFSFIRPQLLHFKSANIRCHFIFKGAYETLENRLEKKNIFRVKGAEFQPGERDKVVAPIFMKEVYEEVLNELGMEYAISVGEFKDDCVALARALNCPILSNDMEYCFSGVPYIPHSNHYYGWDVHTHQIKCNIFNLDHFKNKWHLTDEKLAIFIALSDRNIFDKDFFTDFKVSNDIPDNDGYEYIKRTLSWLSKRSNTQAEILATLDYDAQKKFLNELELISCLFNKHPPQTITTRYMKDKESITFTTNDPEWFQKGVVLKHVPMIYVNVMKFNKIFGSWAIEDLEEDGMLLSIDIIKYSYDLLTNFQSDGFTFAYHQKEIRVENSVRKPDYEAYESPFGNGWNKLDNLYLFVHFLNESLGGIEFVELEQLANDAKLLMIALIYFSNKKGGDVSKLVSSVILSYVMLQSDFKNNNTVTIEEYFKMSVEEEKAIFNRKIVHPLVQIQHCLLKLNCLNTLCGEPFSPTRYHKTCNGTFSYKILYAMIQHGGCHKQFISDILVSAPTVLCYFNNIVNVYDNMMQHYD